MVGAGREAKRRRKTLGIYFNFFIYVERKNVCSCDDADVVHSLNTETEAAEKPAKEEAVVENTTPDYAAGLVSAQVCHLRSVLLSVRLNINLIKCFF